MILKTRRLILRSWRRSDRNDLIEGLDNLKVSIWMAYVPHPYTQKVADGWLKYCGCMEKRSDPVDSYEFAIVLKSENKVIGGTALTGIDRAQGYATAGGIWINEAYQGKRYGAEAFGAKISFAFRKLKLRRVENGYFKGNVASARMQKRLGYKFEGVRRKQYRCMADGKIKDECVMGLLEEDWEKSIRRKRD